MHLSANQEDAFVLPGANPGVRNRQAIDEAAALIADIDRGDVGDPELALEEDAVAGLKMIGRAGAVDDAVEVFRFETGFVERFARRLAREPHAGVTTVDPVPRLDAAPLHDPFVRRVHHLREVVIGDDTRGDVKSGGEELCAWHRSYA